MAEDGIDLDGDIPDMATLQAAMSRAMERYNMTLFTPVGEARADALATLRLVARAVGDGDPDAVDALLGAVPPESPDGRATVAGCTGVALGLLDDWLGGQVAEVPAGLPDRTRLPRGQWTGGRAATDVLALAGKGRAFRSLDSLSLRHGGLNLLHGSALAVGVAVQAWAGLTDATVADVASQHLR